MRQLNRLISLRQASPIAGLALATLRRLCAEGKIPCEKVGTSYGIYERTAMELRERMTPPAGVIPVASAMELAGVTRARIHQLIKAGKVKAVSRPWFDKNLVWVDEESLREWMKGRENGT